MDREPVSLRMKWEVVSGGDANHTPFNGRTVDCVSLADPGIELTMLCVGVRQHTFDGSVNPIHWDDCQATTRHSPVSPFVQTEGAAGDRGGPSSMRPLARARQTCRPSNDRERHSLTTNREFL